MNSCFRLLIHPSISSEEAWKILEEQGVCVLYAEEEDAKVCLITETSISPNLFDWIAECQPYTLPSIDWNEQWEIHGHGFNEGYVHIALNTFKPGAPSIRLKPGCGFGDFSHPTTKIMIKLLSSCPSHQTVIDIGSGSGILTIASIFLGSTTSFGIEIDPKALIHSQENAAINGVEDRCFFSDPASFHWEKRQEPVLIAMNMILCEQIQALNSLSCLQGQEALLVTSGIRKEEKERYLQQIERWERALLHVEEDEDWLGFILK